MKALAEQIAELDSVETYGRVVGVRGLMVEVAGAGRGRRPQRASGRRRCGEFLTRTRRDRPVSTSIGAGYQRLEQILGTVETEN
jgi:hypothetical protein